MQQVLYIYDALCGWCYGFSPVIKRLHETYGGRIPFEIISGGMVLGDRVGPLADKADYLLPASQRVSEMTGVSFGPGFLEGILRDPDYVSSSELPGIALTIVKAVKPDAAIAFAHDVQRAFFAEGQPINTPAPYLPIAERYGLNAAAFEEALQSEDFRAGAWQEFEWVSRLGIQGFPALLFVEGQQAHMLSYGYQPYEAVEQALLERMGAAA
ncbi:MAG: DsbA family protein [Bacteroidia bacterium]|nr:DsbA family protein [Bacteroidia bacterium]